MKEEKISSWIEFEQYCENLSQILAKIRAEDRHAYVSRPLFRGQSNADWNLETSLERYIGSDIPLTRFNRYLLRIQSSVEAFTGKEWILDRDISTEDTTFHSVTNYQFMAYARHHGFPTPLLDWSQSPYVALFFAYSGASDKDDVAVFSYVEDIGKGKGGWVGSPQISEQGEYISAHKRHFMQQSQYTIATKKIDDIWVYCSHHDYIDVTDDIEQNIMTKIILPGTLRIEVLQKLQKMNINAFTLFGSEESLMDMLAFREIIEKDL
ncbi:MAG: FRG domain-containing protein [Mariprofundaceae bacterium]|nr:FRG domain-containing protein [Mariprofundaceae bacterium]